MLQWSAIAKPVSQILQHWSYEWPRFSDDVCKIVIERLGGTRTWSDACHVYDVVYDMCCLNDSVQTARVERLMCGADGLFKVAQRQSTHNFIFCFGAVHALVEMMLFCPPVTAVATQQGNFELWNWMEDFLLRARTQATKEFEAHTAACIIAAATKTAMPKQKPSVTVATPLVFRTEQGQQNTAWVDKVSSEQGQPKLCAECVLEMLRHFMRRCGHVPQPDPPQPDAASQTPQHGEAREA